VTVPLVGAGRLGTATLPQSEATRSPIASSGPTSVVSEVPMCEATQPPPPEVKESDDSVLPDPDKAAQALLAAAAKIAPGRTLTPVNVGRVAPDANRKNPGRPEVYLQFNVATGAGVGSLMMQLIPQTGPGPAELAEWELMARPFRNCQPPAITAFPDSSIGLGYVPWRAGGSSSGNPPPPGAKDDLTQHTSYFGADGLYINVSVDMEEVHEATTPLRFPGAKELPLTADEALALARAVAQSR
jgi:hypothetical protein